MLHATHQWPPTALGYPPGAVRSNGCFLVKACSPNDSACTGVIQLEQTGTPPQGAADPCKYVFILGLNGVDEVTAEAPATFVSAPIARQITDIPLAHRIGRKAVVATDVGGGRRGIHLHWGSLNLVSMSASSRARSLSDSASETLRARSRAAHLAALARPSAPV